MANLSNINNKFIVTDGGNVLVGATADTGEKLTIQNGTSSSALKLTNGTYDAYVGLSINPGDYSGMSSGYGNIVIKSSNGVVLQGGSGGVSMLANGNVGIGAATPDAKLTIYSTATYDARTSGINIHRPGAFGQYGSIAYNINETVISSTYTGTGATDYGSIKFQQFNNGTTPRVVMYLDTSGKVGIGTTSPSSFDADANNLVVGALVGNNGITIASGASAGNYGSIYFADGTTVNKTNAGFIRYEQNTSEMTFGINAVEKLAIDLNGNSTFAGDITLDDDLNFSTNGFADISNTGTGAMRFKPSSQTLALTLTGANAAFAGDVTLSAAGTTGEIIRTTDNTEPYFALQRNSGSNGVGVLRLVDGGHLYIDTGATGAAQSTKMVIEAGGNVGIGTTLPGNKLQVVGNMTIGSGATNEAVRTILTGGALTLQATDANHRIIIRGTQSTNGTITGNSNNMDFYEFGDYNFYTGVNTGTGARTLALTIKSSGNVGIDAIPETGMVSYIKQLRIGEQSGFQGHAEGVGQDSATWVTTNYKFGTSGAVFINGTVATPGYANIYQQQLGDHSFSCSTTTGVAGGAITVKEQMVLKQNGNVGIGTTSPQAQFCLDNQIAHSGTPQTYSTVQQNIINGYYTTGESPNRYTRYFDIACVGDGDGTNGGGNIRFLTNPIANDTAVERMRITSGGGVLIRRTTDDGSYMLQVGDGSVNSKSPIKCEVATTSTKTQIAFNNPSGTVGTIKTAGTSTSYNTSSDYRLKENVVEMTDALDRVSQLKPSRFNFIADADKTVDGFLAHEVQEIVPEAISGEKDAVDEEGNPDYQGIDQSKLVPLLVAAIQELKSYNDSLKARIETLENN